MYAVHCGDYATSPVDDQDVCTPQLGATRHVIEVRTSS
jgi:hypothetical protein